MILNLQDSFLHVAVMASTCLYQQTLYGVTDTKYFGFCGPFGLCCNDSIAIIK